VAEGDNSRLEEDNQEDNHDEPGTPGNVLEDVQLVLNLPGVDEVVDLEEHEKVENDGHVS
jgi:hypothetical protein